MCIKSSNLGYPRIGENREWKRIVDSFWAGELTEANFEDEMEKMN